MFEYIDFRLELIDKWRMSRETVKWKQGDQHRAMAPSDETSERAMCSKWTRPRWNDLAQTITQSLLPWKVHK